MAMSHRTTRARAVALALTTASVLGIATPSLASTPYLAGDANVRDCVTLSAPCGAPFATLKHGTGVTMSCWYDGSWATGRYESNRWFHVVASNGVTGFVHSSLVERQASVGNCNDVSPVLAALRAASRKGQAYASSTDGEMFSASSWEPGPRLEWSGDCPKLGHVAWRGRQALPGGDAIAQYRWYRDRGQVQGGVPPVGALVFWDIARPWGHVAVSMGGNRVATTRGLDGDGAANQMVGVGAFSNYLGWAMPAGSAAAPAPSPHAAPSDRRVGSSLGVDGRLHRGEYLESNGYRLVLQQSDGHLVLYNSSGRAIWATGRTGADFVVLQGDHNLVAYRNGGQPVWASNTVGSGAITLAMQSDGNLVLYSSSRAVWASNTVGR